MAVGQVRFVLYQHEKDNQPIAHELSWDDLAALLLEPNPTPCHPCKGSHCLSKKGLAWSPVVIGQKHRRANENVQGVTLAVFDLDHFKAPDLEALCERLEGFECVIHSTHSHRPPDDICARLVFPLSRTLHPLEWAPFRSEVIRHFGIQADPAAKDLARIFFLPSAPTGNPTIAVRSDGAVLDVDAILKQSHLSLGKLLGQPAAPKPVVMKDAADVDMGLVRRKISSYRPRPEDSDGEQKKLLMQRVLSGDALSDEGSRDVSVHMAASTLAFMVPSDTPLEALVEILRPSVQALPGDPPEFGTWLDKATYSLVRAFERRLQRDAERQAFIDQAHSWLARRGATPVAATLGVSNGLAATTGAGTLSLAPVRGLAWMGGF